MDEEIKGLSDDFFWRSKIEKDSYPAITLQWPTLDEDAVRRLGKTLEDFEAISLVFLLAKDAEQAYGICLKIESKTFVPANIKKTNAEYFLETLLQTAQKRNLRPGWHAQLLSAVNLIGQLKSLMTAENQNVVVKNQPYENTSKRLSSIKYQLLDEIRVKFFEIGENLNKKESSLLIHCLKNNLEPPPIHEKDAAPWPVIPEENSYKMFETNLLELLLATKKPIELLDKISKCLPQIYTPAQDEYDRVFGPIIGSVGTVVAGGTSDDDSPCLQLRRGACLIINNQTFLAGADLSSREGSEKDEAALIKLWKMFSCEVHSLQNLTGDEMLTELDKFSKRVDKLGQKYGDEFFVVVCILSHGRRVNNVDEVMGRDGVGIPTSVIEDKLIDGQNCPGMAGKLKLFLIQACRGDESQGRTTTLSTSKPRDRKDIVEDGAVARPAEKSYPRKSVFIVFNSTIPGCVSYRSRKDGSFFIQAICEVLPKDRNSSVDLLNLFNYANKKMDDELKESSAGEMNQVGVLTHSLFGPIHLPVPKKT